MAKGREQVPEQHSSGNAPSGFWEHLLKEASSDVKIRTNVGVLVFCTIASIAVFGYLEWNDEQVPPLIYWLFGGIAVLNSYRSVLQEFRRVFGEVKETRATNGNGNGPKEVPAPLKPVGQDT